MFTETPKGFALVFSKPGSWPSSSFVVSNPYFSWVSLSSPSPSSPFCPSSRWWCYWACCCWGCCWGSNNTCKMASWSITLMLASAICCVTIARSCWSRSMSIWRACWFSTSWLRCCLALLTACRCSCCWCSCCCCCWSGAVFLMKWETWIHATRFF